MKYGHRRTQSDHLAKSKALLPLRIKLIDKADAVQNYWKFVTASGHHKKFKTIHVDSLEPSPPLALSLFRFGHSASSNATRSTLNCDEFLSTIKERKGRKQISPSKKKVKKLSCSRSFSHSRNKSSVCQVSSFSFRPALQKSQPLVSKKTLTKDRRERNRELLSRKNPVKKR